MPIAATSCHIVVCGFLHFHRTRIVRRQMIGEITATGVFMNALVWIDTDFTDPAEPGIAPRLQPFAEEITR